MKDIHNKQQSEQTDERKSGTDNSNGQKEVSKSVPISNTPRTGSVQGASAETT
jgi:hypothetical protein